MSNRVTQAALKLLLLVEEYSATELAEAIRLLSPAEGKVAQPVEQRNYVKKKDKLQRSFALFALESNDKKKYDLLSSFDKELREGTLFPGSNNLRRFIESIDKGLAAAKSRTSMVSKFIAYLAQRDISESADLIQKIRSSHSESIPDAGYNELAHFIISGKSKRTQT